ncbi:MAG: hypothetical protein WC637_07075 [Victivallales bacterium]|jgi:predicted transcriptional regulator
MHTATVKENAKILINSLPDNSTWDDIMYEIYVKQKIEKGLNDIKTGKVISHNEVKRILGKK